jgi:hypothetical protein
MSPFVQNSCIWLGQTQILMVRLVCDWVTPGFPWPRLRLVWLWRHKPGFSGVKPGLSWLGHNLLSLWPYKHGFWGLWTTSQTHKKCMMKYALDQHMNVMVDRSMEDQFVILLYIHFSFCPTRSHVTVELQLRFEPGWSFQHPFCFFPCERAPIPIKQNPGWAVRLVRTFRIREIP